MSTRREPSIRRGFQISYSEKVKAGPIQILAGLTHRAFAIQNAIFMGLAAFPALLVLPIHSRSDFEYPPGSGLAHILHLQNKNEKNLIFLWDLLSLPFTANHRMPAVHA